MTGKGGSRATPRSPRRPASTTVGELLGHYPRSYVERGRLSDLGELTEGDFLSLVGEIVHSEPKTYQDRRTKRQAYRLEVRVKAEDGVLALTWFDRASGDRGLAGRRSRRRPGRGCSRGG